MREITVLDAGALTTVQDAGRPGHAHLGVPRSGAADQPAYALANRLVGNEPGAAVLETTLTGCVFRAGTSIRVAITGAPCEVLVGARSVAWGSQVVVPAGARVSVGPAQRGLRSYVAFSGGLLVPPVLGSRSTDLLSGLGPAPIRAGDVLPTGEPGEPVAAVEIAYPPLGEAIVRVRLGPRADWFVSPEQIDKASYTVEADSNRIGLRLIGEPIEWARKDELESEPMLLGGVQVPPSGQPVVLLADHATTGGYPVIGVAADVSVLAQVRPGDRVTLRLVR